MPDKIFSLIDRLEKERQLPKAAFIELLEGINPETSSYLFERADAVRKAVFGRDIYLRGLIEFTNYCKNDCYYCGIRKGNRAARRYRLSEAQILECCRTGYRLGFRTFVLQGGEDPYFTDERILGLLRSIKAEYPDCAITLSIGEKSRESYQAFLDAGADRYLLRHETACNAHYRQLHPGCMSPEHRKQCLRDLKDIGFQVGCGFMVGSPHQTLACIAEDLLFIKALDPHMIGIGPFIPHKDSPFARETAGSLDLTLFLLGTLRLMLPRVLLPSTTALATIHPEGRERGILAGANVVMPNLSPAEQREKYMLYDHKACTGEEAAESLDHLKRRMDAIGYGLVVSRGDYPFA